MDTVNLRYKQGLRERNTDTHRDRGTITDIHRDIETESQINTQTLRENH